MDKAKVLETRRLLAFIAVFEEGSFTAAAARMGMAQPALSIAISKLEAQLGTPLLIREPRGVKATAAGLLLSQRAYEIIGLIESTFEEVATVEQHPTGEVAIGLPSSTAAVLAIPLVERLAKTYPGIRLRLVESFSGYLWDWLLNGHIDIAVVFNQASRPEIISTPFAWEKMHLIGKALPGEANAPIEAGQLTGLPMVMPSRKQSFRDTIEHHIQKQGGTLDVQIEIDAGHQLIKLICSGRFYSILSPGSVAHEISTGQLQARPLAQPLERAICLAQRRLRHQATAVRCVTDELLSEARALIVAGVWDARIEAPLCT
ncbi:LysR family transcriptional regulator [Pseudomonas typographi]|uniref:LysR family transcriptional regulator n=1 Tax=Pseudomonas typographi TaxID=2715964 RepID=UPI0016840EC7|nr:LysR family transcriptional regulator [Pseudomonas typographi]MBD1554579.1 LysR family transcriptional regulator [Pseudomonas typographi]